MRWISHRNVGHAGCSWIYWLVAILRIFCREYSLYSPQMQDAICARRAGNIVGNRRIPSSKFRKSRQIMAYATFDARFRIIERASVIGRKRRFPGYLEHQGLLSALREKGHRTGSAFTSRDFIVQRRVATSLS